MNITCVDEQHLLRLNLFLKADKYTSVQQIDYILAFYKE